MTNPPFVGAVEIGSFLYRGQPIKVFAGTQGKTAGKSGAPKEVVDIRKYWMNDDGDWCLTHQGLRITKDKVIELVEILKQVM